MTKKFDYDEDPEGLDVDTGSTGGDEYYDNLAVKFIPYDHSQFELPEDFIPAPGEEDE